MANIDISSVFQPNSSSVLDFLREPGQCFYIPVYQRPYSWDKNNVDRLVSDVVNGLNKITFSSEALTFIGTIISIHDNEYTTIQPVFRTQVPTRVMSVIDGQQRITSILILNTILHEEIKKRARSFEKCAGEHFSWIFDQCSETIGELESTIYEDRKKGDQLYRKYPRIIRAIDDKWSTKKVEAGYTSPIGMYLFEYTKHLFENGNNFIFSPKDPSGKEDKKYSVVVENRKNMKSSIRKITKGEYGDFPELNSIINDRKTSEMVFGHETPDFVIKYIGEGEHEKLFPLYQETLRLLMFANYLNRNVAVTTVTTKEEDYAFDMFEALNTTGEPLSAFETFKPEIIKAEGQENYEASESYKYVSDVDDYLSHFKGADQRQKATTSLLIPFALSEDGQKIGNKLNDQRFYLRKSFEKLGSSLDEKRIFVRGIAETSHFLSKCWPSAAQTSPSIPFFDGTANEDALVCLDFLKLMNHSVVIAPLTTFLSKALAETDEEARLNAFADFQDAVKAVTAFSVMWRASDRGTRNIDNIYRSIMEKGLSEKSVPPFARSKRGKGFGSVTLKGLKTALWHHLEKEDCTQIEIWRTRLKRNPLYEYSKPLTRFILVLASNDTIVHPNNDGLLEEGRKGTHDLLNIKGWKAQDLDTIEHIAPQSNDGTWDARIYGEDGVVDSVGNLTLLPFDENNLLGNMSWEKKKLICRIFSAKNGTEYDDAKKIAEEDGMSFTKKKEDVISASKYLKLTEAIALCEKVWDRVTIENRSENIANLSWRYLIRWVKP